MGYTTSTVHGIEVPDSAEPNNVPEDIGKVVTALEAGSLVKRLTGAQISALTGPQKPAGLVVYNTTTGKLELSNGSTVAEPYGLWTSYTPTLTAAITNPTGWTVSGRYTRIGDTVTATFKLTAGSGATGGSGAFAVALPVAADTTVLAAGAAVGQSFMSGVGGACWSPTIILADANKANFTWPNSIAGGTPVSAAGTSPWTWANGHYITGTITYEAA